LFRVQGIVGVVQRLSLSSYSVGSCRDVVEEQAAAYFFS